MGCAARSNGVRDRPRRQCGLHERLRDLPAGAAPDPEALQTLVFQVAKDSGVQPREWFRTLYRIFLGRSQGPRLGSFIALLGVDKAAEGIEGHIASAA